MSRTLAVLPFVLATASLLQTPEAAAQSDGAACTASAATLGAARTAYTERCTLPRVDCDPVNGAWTCSSGRVGARAPGGGGVPAPVMAAAEPGPAAEPPPVVVSRPAPVDEREGGACEVSAPSIAEAKSLYENRCSAARVDCDPVGGRWTCASYRIGLGAPGRALPPAPSDADRPPVVVVAAPVPSTPSVTPSLRAEAESGQGAGWENTPTSLVWRGTNRFAVSSRRDDGNVVYRLDVPSAGVYRLVMRARATFVENPAEPPNDMWIRFGTLPWTKMFVPKKAAEKAFIVGGIGELPGEPKTTALLESTLPAGVASVTVSGRSRGFELDWIELRRVGGGSATSAPVAVNPAYRPGDLISLHWDSFPDIDDLQAMIAARAILDAGPTRDVLSVAGTVRASFDRVRPGTDEINEALYGSDADNALDSGALGRVVARWRETLDRGATVHVAEGGPSDFTARVLRELRDQGTRGLERVRVVQHSVGANERNTAPAAIADVRRLATYVTIADGNSSNATPGYLVRSASEAASFRSLARASAYGQQWARAFAVARDVNRDVVDFSDAVELLDILGIPKSAAPDAAGFADRYF